MLDATRSAYLRAMHQVEYDYLGLFDELKDLSLAITSVSLAHYDLIMT